MSLGEEKIRILQLLWEQGQPMMMKDVAQKLGLKVAATNMHLLGLKKMGHVYTPKHGYYAIAESGKETIGMTQVNKGLATKILGHVPSEKAFHFYIGLHEYTHVVAHSLVEFAEKLQKIDLKSVEFHVSRRDFENWVQSLGDVELAKRLGLIHKMRLHGEDLRAKVHEIVKHRVEELQHIH